MRYVVDHDLHIHSQLSSCSNDPEQTPARILQYAKENGLKQICLTDHFWDETVEGASDWYAVQDFAHIQQALPLPRAEGVEFLFGCETEMDKFFRIGISPELMEKLDFIIIPTTHMHMRDFTIGACDDTLERRAVLYVQRLHKLLQMDLPFHKIGIAHLTARLIAPANREDHMRVLDMIPDSVFADVFTTAAQKGAGIELNFRIFEYSDTELDTVLRPYKIAKQCGCKFYFGSDAHIPAQLDAAKERFEATVDALALTENDKFRIGVKQ